MIAAVTNYYNPARRKVKWDNFVRFRDGLRGIPLYVVEAAFGDEPFTLPPGPEVLQVRCRDVIWQQYRLVNLGIRQLPDRFDKAVWIDADILFPDPDWHHAMSDMLDAHAVVQSYSRATLLTRDGKPGEVKKGVARKALDNAKNPLVTTLASSLNMAAAYPTGFSWGVRRELVERHGIYDYWITGSSDNAFVLGVWGDWTNQFIADRLNPAMAAHFMAWAEPFHAAVGGRVGCLDGDIRHLWHGERNYKKRWRCLRDFDPATDIGVSATGAFEWRSDKPCLHECCKSMCLNYDIEFSPYL
jgi:hypothetical protein